MSKASQQITQPAVAEAFKRATAGLRDSSEAVTSFNEVGQDAQWTPRDDTSTDRKEQFLRCRELFGTNLWMGQVIEKWAAFANFGLRFKGVTEGRPARAGRTAGGVAKPDPGRELRQFIRQAWFEFFTTDNLVAAWASFTRQVPMVLPPEKCEFVDALGQQSLKYRPEVNVATVTDAALKARLATGMLEIGAVPKEGFRVVRRTGLAGSGFVAPRLFRVFGESTEWENLAYGEKGLSRFCRSALRQHVVGYEIKSGPLAGQPIHHLKPSYAKSIQAKLNTPGARDFTSNFDHTIKFVYPEAAHWDKRRWEALYDRLAWWAGPLGMLLQGTRNQTNLPVLMRALQVEIQDLRENLMRPFIEDVAMQSFGVDVRVTWSTQCFQDTRIWAEMLKFGVQSGPVSPQTFNEETGRDDEMELERKTEAHGQASIRMPVFDAAHGTEPARASKTKTSGRPAGTADPPAA
ncbi:MAG: hypothetical protein ACYDC1_11970 [Limisphaerales bacterium]